MQKGAMNNNNSILNVEKLELLSVQKHPEFLDECIELLNAEWPRSKTARLVSIQRGSPDGFPNSLILINKTCGPGQEKVIAHSKVSLLLSSLEQNACFIESVVVAKNLRGLGLGRLIMEKTEEFVKNKGITQVYLTTHDQQGFYERLGYSLCEAVLVGGGSQMLNSIIHKHTQRDNVNDSKTLDTRSEITGSNSARNQQSNKNNIVFNPTPTDLQKDNKLLNDTTRTVCVPPPPPPPPLPEFTRKQQYNMPKNNIALSQDVKVTMKKSLT